MSIDLMRAMLAQSRLREAEEAARDVIAAAPDRIEAHALLGKLAARRGDTEAALHHLTLAGGGASPDPDVAAALGFALARAGKYQAAIDALRAASAGGSDPLGTLLRLSWVYERLERFDELRDTLARARMIAARQGHDIAVREAILLARTPEWRAALATLDSAGAIAGEDRLARGRLRDRAGRFGDAWEDFTLGKTDLARSPNLSYPAAGIAAHFEQLTRFFDAARMASLPRSPVDTRSPQPIFVTGPPRSGTTLTERLIAADPMVAPRGELPFLSELAEHIAAERGRYPDGMGTIETSAMPAFVRGLRNAYLSSCARTAPEAKAPRFIDKMPFNEQHLPLIALAFPDAPVILMTRHPLDVILSMMSHHMTHGYCCALSPADAARHIAAMDRLTAHWQDIGCRFHRLRYEDLVTDPEVETARIVEFAHLSLDGEAAPASATPATPSYGQVREPVGTRAVFRWRAYADQLREVMPLVTEIAKRRGYDLG